LSAGIIHWVTAPQGISRFVEMDKRAKLALLFGSPPSTISSADAVIE
jgi:hypothetical protein